MHDQKGAAAWQRHQALLKNYPAGDIQNVTAYFENAKVKQFGAVACT